MSEWMPIERWVDCARIERPGIVFEIQNAAGQTMTSRCVQPLPAMPFDWRLPPVRFRAAREVPAEHSAPMPAPKTE